jgi:hypothetical protein
LASTFNVKVRFWDPNNPDALFYAASLLRKTMKRISGDKGDLDNYFPPATSSDAGGSGEETSADSASRHERKESDHDDDSTTPSAHSTKT